jgi:hypothetical protein
MIKSEKKSDINSHITMMVNIELETGNDKIEERNREMFIAERAAELLIHL